MRIDVTHAEFHKTSKTLLPTVSSLWSYRLTKKEFQIGCNQIVRELYP